MVKHYLGTKYTSLPHKGHTSCSPRVVYGVDVEFVGFWSSGLLRRYVKTHAFTGFTDPRVCNMQSSTFLFVRLISGAFLSVLDRSMLFGFRSLRLMFSLLSTPYLIFLVMYVPRTISSISPAAHAQTLSISLGSWSSKIPASPHRRLIRNATNSICTWIKLAVLQHFNYDVILPCRSHSL